MHIRKFNESNNELYTEVSSSELKDSNKVKINTSAFNRIKYIIDNKYSLYNPRIKTSPKEIFIVLHNKYSLIIKINEYLDNWYMISIVDNRKNSDFSLLCYKCDDIEGLIKCINDNI